MSTTLSASPAADAASLRRLVVECGLLLRLAAPLAAAFVGQLAIGTTDMLMLGWYGPEALAASALALSLFNPVMLLGVGIGTAITPLAASAIAGRRVREMRRVVRQGLWAAVPFTALALPVFVLAEPLLVAVGQEPALAGQAQSYLHGAMGGLFAILVFNVLRSYVTALERTGVILLITMAAVPLNALVNYALIFGRFGLPELGVFGAGLGSAITQAAMALAMVRVVARRAPFRRHAIFGRFWRSDWSVFRRIHRIGIPIGLSILLEVTIFGASAQIMGWIGTLQLAAHQIALQLASITFMVPLGVGMAVTARVGQAHGRGDRDGVALAGWAGMALAGSFMALCGLVFWLTPAPLVRPFLDGSEAAPVVLEFAVGYLALAAAFQIADGLQVAAAHALRGLQDTTAPMWIAGFGFWGVGLPVGYLLAMHTPLEGRGVWTGLALGLAVVALLLVVRFHRTTRRSPALDLGPRA